MERRARVLLAVLGTAAFFLVVQFGALALVEPFRAAGYQSVENPQNPVNSAFYVGAILVATAVMLALMRYERTVLLRSFLVLTSALIAGYVFSVVLRPVVVGVAGGVNLSPWFGGGVVALGLVAYPEWWVIDAAGLVMGMGAAALFGISFGILPAILLLAALAVYDAVSVYGTRHMLTLASGVMELRVPVLVIVPTTLSYSFIDDAADMADSVGRQAADGDAKEAAPNHPAGEPTPADADENGSGGSDGGLDREAIFIGLGDAIIPTILVASASVFLDAPAVLGVELPALGAIVGTMAGLAALLWMVLRGRAHAGLPLLNGGSIGGYLVGALASGLSLVTALGLDAVL